MNFNVEWEERYAENTHLSIWPWSDVVSLTHRYCKDIIARRGQVLELGCGAGANIPFFRALGVDYYAIEGSPTIVAQLRQKFPDLAPKIVIGDFTQSLPFNCNFDLILDRGSMTCNTTRAIKKALNLAADQLKKGGLFMSVDLYSTSHTEFNAGEATVDPFTKTNYQIGQFVGLGEVHFSNEEHLRELFADFEIVLMEEKTARRREPKDDHQFASWNIVARKPYD